jgi:hypothetical protein
MTWNSTEPAPIGHNTAGERSLEERRAAYREAAAQFVGNLCIEESWRREQLAQARGVLRLLALKHGHAAALIRGCRLNPQDDAKYGVLGLIVYLSDNDAGACTLSQRRMGAVLQRTEETIRECIKRLEKDGLIIVRRVPGLGMSYTPVGHVSLLEVGDVSPAWVIDALSAPPKPRGRPRLEVVASNEKPRDHPRGVIQENPATILARMEKNPATMTRKTPRP